MREKQAYARLRSFRPLGRELLDQYQSGVREPTDTDYLLFRHASHYRPGDIAIAWQLLRLAGLATEQLPGHLGETQKRTALQLLGTRNFSDTDYAAVFGDHWRQVLPVVHGIAAMSPALAWQLLERLDRRHLTWGPIPKRSEDWPAAIAASATSPYVTDAAVSAIYEARVRLAGSPETAEKQKALPYCYPRLAQLCALAAQAAARGEDTSVGRCLRDGAVPAL